MKRVVGTAASQALESQKKQRRATHSGAFADTYESGDDAN